MKILLRMIRRNLWRRKPHQLLWREHPEGTKKEVKYTEEDGSGSEKDEDKESEKEEEDNGKSEESEDKSDEKESEETEAKDEEADNKEETGEAAGFERKEKSSWAWAISPTHRKQGNFCEQQFVCHFVFQVPTNDK